VVTVGVSDWVTDVSEGDRREDLCDGRRTYAVSSTLSRVELAVLP
jgi:hypothetical protein